MEDKILWSRLLDFSTYITPTTPFFLEHPLTMNAHVTYTSSSSRSVQPLRRFSMRPRCSACDGFTTSVSLHDLFMCVRAWILSRVEPSTRYSPHRLPLPPLPLPLQPLLQSPRLPSLPRPPIRRRCRCRLNMPFHRLQTHTEQIELSTVPILYREINSVG